MPLQAKDLKEIIVPNNLDVATVYSAHLTLNKTQTKAVSSPLQDPTGPDQAETGEATGTFFLAIYEKFLIFFPRPLHLVLH